MNAGQVLPPTLAALVTSLARGHGLAVDDDEVQRRVEALDIRGGALGALELAASTAGLRTSRLRASVATLSTHGEAMPLVAAVGADAWAVVVGLQHGWREVSFVVTDAHGDLEPLTAAGLADRLGVDAGAVVDWLVIETALPMAPIAGAHGETLSSPRRLWALLRLERRDLFVVVAYAVVVALVSLATPLAVQALVSTVAQGTLFQPLIVLSVVVVLALLFAGGLRTLQLYVVEVLQRRVFLRLVADLSWRLPRVSYAERDSVDGSKLVNRFFDVLTLQKSMAALLLEGIVLFLELVVGLTLLAVYSSALTIFAVALMTAIAFVVFVLGRRGIKTSIAESYAKHDVAGWLEDLVRHPTAFRSGHARRLGLARADAFGRDYLGARIAHFEVLLRQNIASHALQAVAAASLLGVGGALVMSGQLSLGQLVAAELILASIVASLSKLGKQLELAYDLFASVDKIGHLIDRPVERIGGSAVAGVALGLRVHELVIEAGTRSLALGSLTLKGGEHLALLGASGSGKSTLIDVVIGLREPSSGRVSIDGDDLRNLSLEAVRERVNLVRDIEIFEGTVGENLRLGRDGLLARDLVEALRIVELDELVLDRKDGLGLHLVPGGTTLSSGQGRRLMIARALLARPGLVIIDGTLDVLEDDLVKRIVGRVRRRLTEQGGSLIIATARAEVAALLPRTVRLDGTATQMTTQRAQTTTPTATTTPDDKEAR